VRDGSVASPCTSVCVIDPASRLCRGCARTLDEIARWGSATEAERRAILVAVEDRAIPADVHRT